MRRPKWPLFIALVYIGAVEAIFYGVPDLIDMVVMAQQNVYGDVDFLTSPEKWKPGRVTQVVGAEDQARV